MVSERDDTLVVSEVFGPTWQGEGRSSGRRAGFVRLGRCSLSCRWCDTAYTWDWERFDPARELHTLTTAQIVARLERMAVDLVVITGGEPLLQQNRLTPLLTAARERRWEVEVETNGIHRPDVPDGLVSRWNVSPKLANSGLERHRRYRPDVLRAFAATGRAAFKFVVCAPGDLDEIAGIVADCDLEEVWVMPEGTDADTVVAGLRNLAPAVLERGWHLSSRLHVMLWGDQRGV